MHERRGEQKGLVLFWPFSQEMASLVSLVSNVTTDAAAGAELLKGLIRLANSTGGADEPMAVAILGAAKPHTVAGIA